MSRTGTRRGVGMGRRLVRLPDLKIGVDENGREPLGWKLCKAIITGVVIAPLLFGMLGFFEPDNLNNVGLLVTLMVSIPMMIASGWILQRWLASRFSSH